MGTSDDLSYLKDRVYHAVQELFEQYSRPVGLKAVTAFLEYQTDSRLEKAIRQLIAEDKLRESSPGVWLPDDAPEDSRTAIHRKLSVRKETIRKQLDLLRHARETKGPEALRRFVKEWCSDLEMYLV